MNIHLVVIEGKGEVLQSGCARRPDLNISLGDNQEFFFGCNYATKIADSSVGRWEYAICKCGGLCFVEALSGGNAVMVNDLILLPGTKQVLKEGDRLKFVNGKYGYTVVSMADERVSGGYFDEVICAVCHGILVKPKITVPCGHTFCEECMPGENEICYVCRSQVKIQVPCLQLQNLIDELVKNKRRRLLPADVALYERKIFMAKLLDGRRKIDVLKNRCKSQRHAGDENEGYGIDRVITESV